ncbi:MAG: hypothetical protein NZT61_03750 [Deltaproteobacteria bacterium]|nr:hypothetical protein [Deltaproteobacteria bacterium]
MSELNISQANRARPQRLLRLTTLAVNLVKENFRELVEQRGLGFYEFCPVQSILNEFCADGETAVFVWDLWRDAATREIALREKLSVTSDEVSLIKSEIDSTSRVRRACVRALSVQNVHFIQDSAWELLNVILSWPTERLASNADIITDLFLFLNGYRHPEFLHKLMQSEINGIEEVRDLMIRLFCDLDEPSKEVLDFLETFFRSNFPFLDEKGQVERPTLVNLGTRSWELDPDKTSLLSSCIFQLGINQRISVEELFRIALMLEPPYLIQNSALQALIHLHYEKKLPRVKENRLIDLLFYAIFVNDNLQYTRSCYRIDLRWPNNKWPDVFIEKLKYFFCVSVGSLREYAFDLLIRSNKLSFEEYLAIFRNEYIEEHERSSGIVKKCLNVLVEKAVESGDKGRLRQVFDALRLIIEDQGRFCGSFVIMSIGKLIQAGYELSFADKNLLTELCNEAISDLNSGRYAGLELETRKLITTFYFFGIGQDKINPSEIVDWLKLLTRKEDQEFWHWIKKQGISSSQEHLIPFLEEAVFSSFNKPPSEFEEWQVQQNWRFQIRNIMALIRRLDPEKFVSIGERLLQKPELLWHELVGDLISSDRDQIISIVERLLTASETAITVKNCILWGILEAHWSPSAVGNG